MTLKFKGKVWIFGDNLDVDKDIIPFRKMNLGLITFDNLGDWCMTNIDHDFPRKVKKGDIMVVGKNMGCGHSHQQANLAIKQCGISCVIAESFDRNFFRNSVAIGLPLIEFKDIKQYVKEGDELEVDLHKGQIKSISSKKVLNFTPLPDFLLDILEAGSIELHVNKLIAEGKV
jgi:3-isopropylmalate/(R)-2-methylmalate dehydratase small subunit